MNVDYISILQKFIDTHKIVRDAVSYDKVNVTPAQWECQRAIMVDWTIKKQSYHGKGTATTKKAALNEACKQILDKLPPIEQMEQENSIGTDEQSFKEFAGDPLVGDTPQDTSTDNAEGQQDVVSTEETVGGVMNQLSTKAANTIITADKTRTMNPAKVPRHGRLIRIASSEPTHTFPSIQNRWTPVRTITISAGQNINVILYPVDSLINDRACSIANIPFEVFAYTNISCQVLFKVIANKFQSGRLVAALVKDPFGIIRNGAENSFSPDSMVNGEHVMLDLNSSQEAVLSCPFIYPRVFNTPTQVIGGNPGLQPGEVYAVILQSLDPMKTGSGGITSCTVSVWVRLVNATYAGMVPIEQMDGAISYDANIKKLDAQFSSVGFMPSADKPSIVNSSIIIPKPIHMNAPGRGYSTADKLAIDGGKLTSYFPDHHDEKIPRSFNAMARVWGLATRFEWTPDHSVGEVLLEVDLDPSIIGTNGIRRLVPIEYASQCFQFWSGTQEFRFDFVATSFHTGTISITFEYGRPNPDDQCGGFSSYTKTIHVQDQKSFTVTAPYIYDTVWRRTRTLPFMGQQVYTTGTTYPQIRKSRPAVWQGSYAKMVVRVVNKLVPTQSVAPSINVLVYRRGDESFRLYYPIAANVYTTGIGYNPDNFPMDYDNPSAAPVPSTSQDPVEQMDNGSKETLDATKDFSTAVSAGSVQTEADRHTDFYDLLRRPVKVISNVYIGSGNGSTSTPANNYAFFIPIQPITPNSLGPDSDYNVRGFSRSCRHSIHCAIVQLFRHWRGSLRYTIVVEEHSNTESQQADVLYVYHLPHTGARIWGAHYLNSPDGLNAETDFVNMSLACQGLPFGVISTTVNHVGIFEVPFATEMNWCRTWEADPNVNEVWAEKTTFNAGHIVLQVPHGTLMKVSVWLEVGADFMLHGFNPYLRVTYPGGHPNTALTDQRGKSTFNSRIPRRKRNACAHKRAAPPIPTIDVPMEQMDIPEEQMQSFRNLISNSVNTVTSYLPSSTVPIVASAVHPSLGTGVMIHRVDNAVNSVTTRLEATTTIIEDNMQEVGIAARIAQATMSGINATNDKLADILNSIKSIVAPFGSIFSSISEYTSILMDAIFEFCHVLISPTAKTVALSIVNMLRKLKLVTFELASDLVTSIYDCISYFFHASEQLPTEDNDWHNAVCSFCGLLIGAVSGMLGMKYTGSWSEFMRGLFKNSGMIWSVTVNSARFLKDTLVFIRRFVFKLIGRVNPNVTSLDFFQEKSEFVNRFVMAAQNFLNEANTNTYRTNPQWRVQGWITMMNACVIQQELCKLDMSARNIAPTLARLCQDVKNRANTLSCDMTASPVRYEPYVIALEGGSGIGKSFLTTDLIVKMLQGIGYTTQSLDVSFVKNPGPDFWNGIDNQPVIVYDDWMASSETQTETSQLMELMSLKSTAVFNPNIAQLEQKNKKINPLIIILLTNKAFPQISQAMRTPEAIYRRRDMVWSVQKTEQYHDVPLSDIPQEVLDTFGHLEFEQYADVCDPGSPAVDEEPLSYQDFATRVIADHNRYNVREKRNVRRRLDTLQTLLPQNAPRFDYDQDPFSLFFATQIQVANMPELSQNAMLPSEELTMAIMTFLQRLETLNQPTEQAWVPNWLYDLLVQRDRSTGVLDSALDYIRGLGHWIYQQGALFNTHHTLTNVDCCLCDEGEVKYVCGTDATVKHGLCQNCYNGVNRNTRCCPICRHPDFIPYVAQGSTSAFVNILRGVARCVTYSDKLNFITRNVFTPGSRVCTFIECTLFLRAFNYLILPHMPTILPEPLCTVDSWIISAARFTMGSSLIVLERVLSFMAVHFLGMATIEHIPPERAYEQMDPQSPFTQRIQEMNARDVLQTPPVIAPYQIGPDAPEQVLEPVQTHQQQQSAQQLRRQRIAELNENAVVAILLNLEASREIPDNNWIPEVLQLNDNPVMVRLLTNHTSDAAVALEDAQYSAINRNYFPPQRIAASPVPGRCMHIYIAEHINRVRYYERKWQIINDNHFEGMFVTDCACEAEDCIWAYAAARHIFYAMWTGTQIGASTILRLRDIPVTELNMDHTIPHWLHPDNQATALARQAQAETLELQQQAPSLMYKILNKLKSNIGTALKFILGAVAGVGILYGMYRTTKAMYNFFFGDSLPMEQSRYDPGSRPRFHVPRGIQVTSAFAHGRAQMDSTNSAYDAVSRKLFRNAGFIMVVEGTEIKRMLRFQGIRGKYALIPAHYVREMKRNPQWKYLLVPVQAPAIQRPYIYNDEDFIVSEAVDAALFKLPIHYPTFSDVVKFMPKTEEWKTLVLPRELTVAESKIKDPCVLHRVNAFGFEKDRLIRSPDGSARVQPDVISYTLSRHGMCGSSVMLEVGNTPLIGMHIAGSGIGYAGRGYAVPLVYEDYSWIPKCEPPTVAADNQVIAKVMPVEQSEILYHGQVPKSESNHISSETSLRPSMIQHALKPWISREPAILSPRDERYEHEITPLVAGISKHGKLTGHIPTQMVIQIKDMLVEMLQDNTPLVAQVGVLDPKTACVGRRNLPYYDPIVLTTSSGYPWNKNGATTKERYIKFMRDAQQQPIDCEIAPEVLAKMKLNSAMRAAGKCVPIVYCDSLKDELKSSETVRKLGKTRVFCMSPIDNTIEIRQYYQDFVAAFMQNRHSLHHAVGIAADGPEWSLLIHNLMKKNNKFVCFDYSNFGPGFNAQLGEVAMDAMANWYVNFGGYSQADEQMRRMMKYELLNSLHIAHDCMYQQFGGSPSGAAITTIINSLVNLCYIFYVWLKYCEDTGVEDKSYKNFNTINQAYVYGDDVILTSKYDDFNGEYFQANLNQIGCKITSSISKDADVEAHVTIKKASFLKRGFLQHPTKAKMYLAPIDKDSVYNCPLYIHKTPDVSGATEEAVKAALDLAYGHGPDFYAEFQRDLNTALTKNGLRPQNRTWEALDLMFFPSPSQI